MTSTENSVMIDVKDLSKEYGFTRALSSLSFQVKRGEVLGFLGPNGAGKTTTMRILTGYLKPSGGTVKIAGMDVREHPLEVRRKIGYLPENAPLYDEMMVIDFLRYAAELREIPREEQDTKLKSIIESCGLAKVLGKDIKMLSKGYRQRVGLAQAMLHDPDLLILDEPTSGLDPNQIVEIRSLIKELGKEKTVILSTHILPEVQATCNRIIIINEGKLVADNTPDELTGQETGSLINVVVKSKNGKDLDPEATKKLFAELPGVRSVQQNDGEGPKTIGFSMRVGGDEDPREKIFSTAVDQQFVLLDMHREQVSLEDTFRKLTLGEGGKNE